MFCLVFYFLYFIFFQINSFYFKIKYFSQKIIFKNLFQKNSLESSGSKFLFFIIICNHILFGLASFSVFNKNSGFEQRHESKLVVPNKWGNSKLNSCISIGELVKPLYKKIFSKFIFVATFDTCWNHVYLFFRNYI